MHVYCTVPEHFRERDMPKIRSLFNSAVLLFSIAVCCNESTIAQDTPELDGREGRELLLRNFRPNHVLRVKQTNLTQARFPTVDVHSHFYYRLKHADVARDDYIELMDRNNIAVACSRDGMLGDRLEEHRHYLKDYDDRVVIFANINWKGSGHDDTPETWDCNQAGFVRHTVHLLQEAVESGVGGLKLFKGFGLSHRNADGTLIQIDDERFDPIWKACGDLGIPVIIHTADPIAFFETIDETNERWEELSRHPEWSFPADKYPSYQSLISARNRVIARHPGTNFICAHVASSAHDLSLVASWLEEYDNMYVGFASRISELGRQPYTARRFLIRYADRVLFSTDGPWPEQRVKLYWRFLETNDEYFPYSEKEFPPQGLWQIYGVHLPEKVLRQIYYENAARIVPGVKERLNAYRRRR